MAQPVHFKSTVSGIKVHSEDVHSYTLVSGRRLPKFLPGQFIHLSLDDYDPSGFWPESRVFSVANSVNDNLTLNLVIAKQGGYTKRIINELKVGSVVSCKGPYGDFVIRPEVGELKTIVLIAGGTGITPFSAFIESMSQQDFPQTGNYFLFYGARTSDLLIFKKLADDCAEKFKNFKPFYFAEKLSQVDNPRADINLGRLNVNTIVNIIKPDKQTLFYLSGPKLMIDDFSHNLTKVFQYPPENIIIDAW